MESFRVFLFGVTGVSVIFWVSILSIWLAGVFPKLFREESDTRKVISFQSSNKRQESDLFMQKGALRPEIKGSTLYDRSKYSRRSLVVADFSKLDNLYPNNKVYTFALISLGVMSFLIMSYALMPSGLALAGFDI